VLGNRGRLSIQTIGLLVAVTVLVATGIVLWQRQTAPPPSTLTAAPTGAPDTAAASAAPLFDAWLRFESPDANQQSLFRSAYIDATLGHQVFQYPPQGLPSSQAHELMLDDDKLLLSSGRRLWNNELLHQPGMAGKFCYLHSSFCVRRLFDVQFFVDGKPAVIYDNQYGIVRFPSHTSVTYRLGPVKVEEVKYITLDDQAVATYRVSSLDKQAHQVDIEVGMPYLTMPNSTGEAVYPLLGAGKYQGLPLFVYADAPGFERLAGSAIHLRRQLSAPADGAVVQAQVAVSFDNHARSGAPPPLSEDTLARHQRTYNQWFADNVPYFDASDPAFKKMWYYRWWVVRFNMLQADTPDMKGYRFYEGKLGFDNAIVFALPLQIEELMYLRDPSFGLQQITSAYANVAENGALVDPSGSPYWGETYSHWATAAVLEFNRVQPMPAATLRALLPAMARDVRAWETTYDQDGDGLPERAAPRVTGYDLDILSYWYFNDTQLDVYTRPPSLERVDFASFVYANARGLAQLARDAGDVPLQTEFDATAARIRTAVLENLWDDDTQFFYPRQASDHTRIPIRELHGFFPFTTQLAPDEPRYLAALKKFVDPEEFWSRYPPVITSLYHYKRWKWGMDGLSRNIAPHPISMGARTLLETLKHYHQDSITPAHFMELMTRYNTLMYSGVNPYDPLWRPNAHEYYSKWEPNQSSTHPKPSEISHDFHSMYCSLIVEGAVGLTPRDDDKIELQPLALQWTYFLLDRLRYRGHDLTIVWDQPDGQIRYAGYPEGFSLYVDGKVAFTRNQLGHVLYDPTAGTVSEINGPSPAA
jgi:hypothetical protein